MTQTQDEQHPVLSIRKKKPLLCRVVLAISLTYFIILSLLFVLALVFSTHIREVFEHYAHTGAYSPRAFTGFAATGAGLFLSALGGLLLMRWNRKGGFYLFVLAVLAIMALDLIFLPFDWLRYLIHSGLFFLTGIAHFSGRCYRRSPH